MHDQFTEYEEQMLVLVYQRQITTRQEMINVAISRLLEMLAL